jgi:hypothetical protein
MAPGGKLAMMLTISVRDGGLLVTGHYGPLGGL